RGPLGAAQRSCGRDRELPRPGEPATPHHDVAAERGGARHRAHHRQRHLRSGRGEEVLHRHLARPPRGGGDADPGAGPGDPHALAAPPRRSRLAGEAQRGRSEDALRRRPRERAATEEVSDDPDHPRQPDRCPCGERSLMAGVLVFLLAGGCAFFLSLLALDVLRRGFEQYQRRYLARSVNDLSGMFLFLDPKQILRLNLCALLLLAAGGYWAGGGLFAALAATAGFFSPSLLVRLYRRRRLLRFNAQLVDGLQQMANALRAGFTLQQAVDQVGREGDAPLRPGFGLFMKEVKLGLPLDDALAAMAKRLGSEELDLIATS